MEFGGQEEELGMPMAMPVSYDSIHESSKFKMLTALPNGGGGSSCSEEMEIRAAVPKGAARYRECQKNHAATIGGQAVDGCGEFMASGGEETLDALKCAACGCHRNFHRKEVPGEPPACVFCRDGNRKRSAFLPIAAPLALPLPAHLAFAASAAAGGDAEHRDHINASAGLGMAGLPMKKRFRTKFSQDQKDKLLSFAEKLGWRIQKQDEAAVQLFCQETGVKRHVLKVWMHNNKHTLGRKT